MEKRRHFNRFAFIFLNIFLVHQEIQYMKIYLLTTLPINLSHNLGESLPHPENLSIDLIEATEKRMDGRQAHRKAGFGGLCTQQPSVSILDRTNEEEVVQLIR